MGSGKGGKIGMSFRRFPSKYERGLSWELWGVGRHFELRCEWLWSFPRKHESILHTAVNSKRGLDVHWLDSSHVGLRTFCSSMKLMS